MEMGQTECAKKLTTLNYDLVLYHVKDGDAARIIAQLKEIWQEMAEIHEEIAGLKTLITEMDE